MKNLILFICGILAGCSTNPTGPQGYLGGGDKTSLSYYIGTLTDQYNDTVSA